MSAAKELERWISEPLTWEQICERYPDEWVCLVEMDRDLPQNFEFRTARVIGHGKRRSDPWDQAEPWWGHYNVVGHYYTSRVRVTVTLLDGTTADLKELLAARSATAQ